MRIIGFILLVALSIPNITVRRRLPPSGNINGKTINLKIFRNLPLAIYTLNIVINYLGLFTGVLPVLTMLCYELILPPGLTVLTYIDIGAANRGISAHFSFYLVTIANGTSLLGRISSGFGMDHFGASAICDVSFLSLELNPELGPLNFIIPMTTGAGIVTMFWPFAATKGTLVVIAILYGYFIGGFGMFLVPAYHMGPDSEIGQRTGLVLTIAAAGALAGPPISGAIIHTKGGLHAAGYYAGMLAHSEYEYFLLMTVEGSMILLSVILMIATRRLILGQWWGKA
jgi:MFS transporter, MCT family, solute carrier family 16 (monocarboxylic acid transporters), member 10